MTGNVVYSFGDSLYVNLTNRCPTACVFCPKFSTSHFAFAGSDLRLDHEPGSREVLEAVGDPRRFREIVFCGFGEPTLRLDVLTAAGASLRKRGGHVRLNTVGLGNLVHGRNIVPELKAAVESVSVSLNTANPAQWSAFHRPTQKFSTDGFYAVRGFIGDCVAASLPVTATAIGFPDVDVPAVRALAGQLGARFRLRPRLEAL